MKSHLARPEPRLKLCGLASLLALALTGGCAGMSEEECVTADWEMIGYEDGIAGQPAGRIADHRVACADHGVTPDMAAYRRGREQGLQEYCRPDQAYQLGRRGGRYSGVCPVQVASQVAAAYEAGRQIYDLESRIRRTEGEIRHREQELSGLQAALENLERELVDGDTSNERRLELVLETRRLIEHQSAIRSEIDQLHHRANWERGELQQLTSSRPQAW